MYARKNNYKKCATYDNVGCTIELNKINFIYRANGTGKTTISKYIKTPTLSEFSNCQLKWKNIPIDVLVYNKEFREENFSTGKINGVFTLGKATKEEIEIIENKTVERNKIVEDGKQKADTLSKQKEKLSFLEDNFKEDVWTNLYKKNEKNFKDALRGSIGSKESFKNKIISEFTQTNQTIQTLDELISKGLTIFSEVLPTSIDIINIISNETINEIENNAVWNKVIIGKSDVEISKLIHKLNIDDWVNEGRSYIEKDVCPFCQEKTISSNFISQLESYFDETYLQELDKIKLLRNSYFLQSENIINHYNQIESFQKNLQNSN